MITKLDVRKVKNMRHKGIPATEIAGHFEWPQVTVVRILSGQIKGKEMTKREQVKALNGKPVKQVAEELDISPKAVKKHRNAINKTNTPKINKTVERCPGCGGLVSVPCLGCRIKGQRGRRVLG